MIVYSQHTWSVSRAGVQICAIQTFLLRRPRVFRSIGARSKDSSRIPTVLWDTVWSMLKLQRWIWKHENVVEVLKIDVYYENHDEQVKSWCSCEGVAKLLKGRCTLYESWWTVQKLFISSVGVEVCRYKPPLYMKTRSTNVRRINHKWCVYVCILFGHNYIVLKDLGLRD